MALRRSRDELKVAEEQHRHFADEAADAALRAIVSESRGDKRAATAAQRHADAFARERAKIGEEIARLERDQDRLLDQLNTAG